MDIAEIARMLAGRIDDLVVDLLPNAVKRGPEWCCGSVMGEPGTSMRIRSTGGKAGVWSDFSDHNMHGDALDLVSQVKFGGNKAHAVAWAKSWLGIDTLDPARLREVRRETSQKQKQAQAKARQEADGKQRYAAAIWHGAEARLAGTPVDLYLLGRGIGLADLRKPPGSIRYAPALKYPDGTEWPAMVSMVLNGKGEHIATHRTYLKNKGGGVVTKVPVKDAKLTIGSYRGGFIPLSRGGSNMPLTKAPAGDKVILCEGIEDGLSLALCCPGHRVLACIAVNNFQNICLPPTITDVTIAADNDAPDSPAARAVQAAVDIFIDQGRDVFIARAPIGKDFNDTLCHQADQINARGG